MKKEVNLILTPEQAYTPEGYRLIAAQAAGIPPDAISGIRIIRKSVDARGRQIKINMAVEVFSGEEPASPVENVFRYQPVQNKPEVVVVGTGPAGLFAALRLIELGFRPLLLERGKPAHERKKDIDLLENNHELQTDSNYCFGEGGAGTFSDGKLYTRSKKRGDITRILEILYLHGADKNILYEAHPHIGSDKLPEIISSIRKTILNAGGIIRFETRVTDLSVTHGKINHLLTHRNEKITAAAYIFATGHSARDIYYLFNSRGITIEAKPFAMGVRVEHPQELINHIQYHGRKDKYLPAASYNLVEQVNGRGVYSFCMCPGGQIVPSATANYEIVVNGMSVSKRNSPFANSGIVVQVLPEDYRSYQNMQALAALHLQELLEQKAYKLAHSGQKAPAQRLTDFVSNRSSQDLPVCSYMPGTVNSPMHEWMPDFVRKNLQEGFKKFDTRMRGFLSRDAVIVGVESRTSSPIRIPRNPETGNHTHISNLFTAGEGAGFAGGIVSSAIDGENMAAFCANYLNSL
ncbi:MAG: FAD-binding protein [Bacteroidales bacterium]|nr:FAD-binding protein [Bacteroidales bacterium]